MKTLPDLFVVAFVVELQETGEEFFAGGGGDGVAGAVVVGEGFDLVEVVAEVDGGAVGAGLAPAVGGEDGLIEIAVEVAEVEDGVAGLVRSKGAGGGAVFGRDLFGTAPVAGFGALLTLPTLAGERSRAWKRL